MWVGLLFAISACFVWGAIFVIPEFLSDFTGVELVLGRYLMYGTISSALFFRKGFEKARQVPKKAWVMAFIFALISNILYYFGIISGIRFASAPLTVLVIGMAPVVIAIYGNWRVREISFKSMILPGLWMIAGLVLVNVAEVDWSFKEYSLSQYLIGIVGVMVALLAWSWYVVHNARFLKRNPSILSTDWTTAIGVCTFFWVIMMGIAFSLILPKEVDLAKFGHWSNDLLRFLIGITILGAICSWLGCYLWNRASVYLPVSLMGPFLIFESLFGLLYVYFINFRMPSLLEIIGVISMLGGILLSVWLFRRQTNKRLTEKDD